MTGKFLAAGLAVLVPLTAHASVIRQEPCSLPRDAAIFRESDAFVVCSDCRDDRLSLLPAPPKLAVRLSMGEPQLIQTQAMEPAASSKSTQLKGCVSCLLDTVHFPFDSAEITQRERSRLDELIRGIKEGDAVNFAGFTCDLGTPSHNRLLSLSRAQSVASYLKGKGIAVGKVSGLGECCPVSDDRRLNRRVEISTERKEEK